MQDINFNSIKVQLELATNQDLRIVIEFQFHKGTIRTITSFFEMF